MEPFKSRLKVVIQKNNNERDKNVRIRITL